MDKRPIGIFDSGLGGLTVVREIQKALPSEDIVYFGDTARVPYGTKSKETVTRFSKENVSFLLKFKVKLVVVACNTASSLSLGALVKSFDLPIIGVIEPGVNRAVDTARNGAVGVIGTRSTIQSGTYQNLLKKSMPGIKIVSRPCPLFVPLVEEGWLNNGVTFSIVKEYLSDFKNQKVKTLILGCTHYPLLKPIIKKFMGRDVKLIDSAHETAKMVKEVLSKKGLLSDKKGLSNYRYFVTDEPAAFKKIGERFLKSSIKSIRKV